ncbi:hypothetical protein AOXY_G34587 [Acipenser oxyrinchus oxyrinchus]|uniref:Uncharacterized protein n=1 Tax=Acipenser oxyrinchus oxyrinchus TaxID=40147 RepID=A0AAD8FQH2_ACIOX|nr:hypothetical protein AOXY_G34587 [Acipenser oxyrinchus oxyrinchus]
MVKAQQSGTDQMMPEVAVAAVIMPFSWNNSHTLACHKFILLREKKKNSDREQRTFSGCDRGCCLYWKPT